MAAASYTVSNGAAATDGNGNALPVTGSAGTLRVITCNGDCNGNGAVTLGEAVKAVNMFLGQPFCHPSDPARNCPVADTDADGHVSIGEVVQTVNRFLGGCPSP